MHEVLTNAEGSKLLAQLRNPCFETSVVAKTHEIACVTAQ